MSTNRDVISSVTPTTQRAETGGAEYAVMTEHRLEITDDTLKPATSVPLSRVGALIQQAIDRGAPDDASWFVSYRKLVVTWKTAPDNSASPVSADSSPGSVTDTQT